MSKLIPLTVATATAGMRVVFVEASDKPRMGRFLGFKGTLLSISNWGPEERAGARVMYDEKWGTRECYLWRFAAADLFLDLSKPLFTRSGSLVRLVAQGDDYISARVPCPDGVERILIYPPSGIYYKHFEQPIDLVNQ